MPVPVVPMALDLQMVDLQMGVRLNIQLGRHHLILNLRYTFDMNRHVLRLSYHLNRQKSYNGMNLNIQSNQNQNLIWNRNLNWKQ